VPLYSLTGFSIWRALRAHLDTTCSVLWASVPPQKTHGGVDLFLDTTECNRLQLLVRLGGAPTVVPAIADRRTDLIGMVRVVGAG